MKRPARPAGQRNGEETVDSDEEMAEALISAEQVLVTDYPLNEALNVLKGVNAFRPAARSTTAALPSGMPCSQRPAAKRNRPECPINGTWSGGLNGFKLLEQFNPA